MNINCEDFILDFLTGIHGSRGTDRSEKMFQRAFEKAYRDMATHTVELKDEYKKNDKETENSKNAVKESFRDKVLKPQFDKLPNIESQNDFNKWHKEICDLIINGTVAASINVLYLEPLTYGQAQKLINMMVKYLYIYDRCEGKDSFSNIVDYFHVPLDSYVFKGVKKIANEKNSNKASSFSNANYNGNPWSKITTYDKYLACEKDIKDIIAPGNPFMWEIRNWPFGF